MFMEHVIPYLIVAGSSAAVYIFLIVAIRLFGKKEFSQLSVFDIVFILLISNAVQNSMIAADISFLGGIVSAATLFIVNFIVKNIFFKVPKVSELIQGHPMLLIYEGKPLPENMEKAKVSILELEEATREHGVDKIENVSLAVLELDGSISIVSGEFLSQTRKKRRRFSNEI